MKEDLFRRTIDDVTPTTIEQYALKHGARNAKALLSVLGKKQALYNAIQSEVGQAFLKSFIEKMDELLDKIIDEEASDVEKTEYRIRAAMIKEWAEQLKIYEKHSKKLKGV